MPCYRVEGFFARARGLLGTVPGHLASGTVLVFADCASLHTVGMAYPLDIAFLDHRGRVEQVHRGVPPGRVLRCPGAKTALEREATSLPWFEVGEEVALIEQ